MVMKLNPSSVPSWSFAWSVLRLRRGAGRVGMGSWVGGRSMLGGRTVHAVHGTGLGDELTKFQTVFRI